MNTPQKPPVALPLADTGVREGAAAQPTGAGRLSRWGRRLMVVPLVWLAMATGAVVGLYFQPPGLQFVFARLGLEPGGGTDTPIAVAIQRVQEGAEIAVVSEGDVVALGRILPRGDVSTVATPYGAGDARVSVLSVQAGDRVEAGQVLAVLDNLSFLQGQLDAARASRTVAEATLAQTRAAIRAARDESQAALERAQATERVAADDLARVTSLFERGVASRSVLDAAIARATETARDVERLSATLSRYDSTAQGQQPDIAVAEANLDAAAIRLAQAESDLERAYVRAPIAGTVLNVHVQLGERPGAQGILDLGDTAQMTVEAEVYQTLIGRVAVGDAVTLSAPALGADLTGQVSAIGLEIGRQSITSDDPAANTDARVIDVIVALDAQSSARAERFTNLQVVARIDATGAAGGRP